MTIAKPVLSRIHCGLARVVVAIILSLRAFAAAQTGEIEAVVDRVKRLVEGGQYAEAIVATEQVGATVSDGRPGFELQFLRGVAAQRLADDSTQSPATRSRAFAQSQAAYERASQLRPTSLATLNNLGALNASAGRDSEAVDYYRRAATLAVINRDPNLETYAFNFAEFLKDRDGEEAVRQALIAVGAPNSGAESRDLLAKLYARYQPAKLLPFARTMFEEGRIGRVRELAVTNIKDSALESGVRREWFTLLALTMARDTLGQATYDPGMTLDQLSFLSAADPIAPAAKQLLQAIREPPGTVAALTWWLDAKPSEAVRSSSRQAMRELLNALGQRTVQFSPAQAALAIRYFRTAIEFGDRGPDPDAFLSLVNLYADVGDTVSLRALMGRYEMELFSEKGNAYGRGDWSLIFRLHTALGMTYAHLGTWKSETTYQNALFQLEAARRAADQLNSQEKRKGQPAKYTLPPAAVRKLAEGYEAVGQPQKGSKVRVDSAETLSTVGRTKEGANLIRSFRTDEVEAMSAETKTKFEKLRASSKEN
jgi:hypothetical protein